MDTYTYMLHRDLEIDISYNQNSALITMKSNLGFVETYILGSYLEYGY